MTARRRRDLERRAERLGARDRVAAVGGVVGDLAADEELVPRLLRIARAPDLLRLARRIRMQLVDREQEGVDRDVVHRLELVLEPVAERAVGVREDDELALAVALDALEGEVHRQLVEADPRELARARLGQVLLGRRVVDRADQHVVGLRVGVDELVVEQHLEEAEVARLGDVVDLGTREFLLQRLLDGERLAGQRGRCGGTPRSSPAACMSARGR